MQVGKVLWKWRRFLELFLQEVLAEVRVPQGLGAGKTTEGGALRINHSIQTREESFGTPSLVPTVRTRPWAHQGALVNGPSDLCSQVVRVYPGRLVGKEREHSRNSYQSRFKFIQE